MVSSAKWFADGSLNTITTATGPMAEINPLRYRGYYYDSETGLYYVSSRYYNPEIGRFIPAGNDPILSEKVNMPLVGDDGPRRHPIE